MLAYKVVVVGAYAVGKTTLVLNFTEHRFQELYIPTIGVQFSVKDVYYDDELVKLTIWDIAGQEEFKYVRTEFYKGANAQILVYDVTRHQSLEEIKAWYDDVCKYAGDIPALVLGNKNDLESQKEIGYEYAKDYVEKLNFNKLIGVIETSAKLSKNVDKAFYDLTDYLVNKI
ncbi:MAG: GTP-binding protein [Promethearchaeota archaeon]|nr:MAG: GTP-binding protein [Candidatus Lokiarchaeota archaeon]